MRRYRFLVASLLLSGLSSCSGDEKAAPGMAKPRDGGVEIDEPAGGFKAVSGQSLYVPAYSAIYISNDPRRFDLAITLSIRNADQQRRIILTSVRYFNHDGKLVREYLKKPLRVDPMAAVEFFVGEKDESGGVSASFLVDWLSDERVDAPLVESVMVGAASTQGVSFTSRARVVSDRERESTPKTDAR